MNTARVIHGIAVFMLLGVAFLMLREFGISYKFGTMALAFRQQQGSLPWLSALVLPFAPIAWWSAFTPLCCAIGVAVRVPANSPVSLAIHWLAVVLIVIVAVLGVFFAYLKATAVMGYPMITPPTPLEIGTNAALLTAAGFWMIRGIIQARRGQ